MASVYIQLPVAESTQAALSPTYVQSLIIDNVTVVTFTAPTGAKKAKIMADGDNSVNLKMTADGSTAPTATVGMQLEPGRSEDFDGVSDIKVIAETVGTNQAVYIHWSV